MNQFFYIIWHDERRGLGETAFNAIEAAIGTNEYHLFCSESPVHGYQWSAYFPQAIASDAKRLAPVSPGALHYEVCTINHKGLQLCQVFKTQSIKTIQALTKRYGIPKQLRSGISGTTGPTRTTILSKRPVIRVPSKPDPRSEPDKPVKSTGPRLVRSKGSPPRRVGGDGFTSHVRM